MSEPSGPPMPASRRSCGEYEPRIVDYACDTLTEAERHELELHLAECPGCRDEARLLRAVYHQAAAALTRADSQGPPARVRTAALAYASAAARLAARPPQATAPKAVGAGQPTPSIGPSRGWRRPWLMPTATSMGLLAVLLVAGQRAGIFEPARPRQGVPREEPGDHAPGGGGRVDPEATSATATPREGGSPSAPPEARPRSGDPSSPPTVERPRGAAGTPATSTVGDTKHVGRPTTAPSAPTDLAAEEWRPSAAGGAPIPATPSDKAELVEGAPAAAMAPSRRAAATGAHRPGAPVGQGAPAVPRTSNEAGRLAPRAAPLRDDAAYDEAPAGDPRSAMGAAGAAVAASEGGADQNLDGQVARAEAHFAARRWSQAADGYRALLDRYPNHRSAALWRARWALARQRSADAPADAP